MGEPAGLSELHQADPSVEPDAYRALGTRLVLENMDDMKATRRIADEMETFFEALSDAGFCFDIAHAHSVDPSMDIASELLNRSDQSLIAAREDRLRDGV